MIETPEKFICFNCVLGSVLTGLCGIYATWFGPWPFRIAETLHVKDLLELIPALQKGLDVYAGEFVPQAEHYLADIYLLNFCLQGLSVYLFILIFDKLKSQMEERSKEELIFDEKKLIQSHLDFARGLSMFILGYLFFMFFDSFETNINTLSYKFSNRILVYPIDSLRLSLFSFLGSIGMVYSFTSYSLYRSLNKKSE